MPPSNSRQKKIRNATRKLTGNARRSAFRRALRENRFNQLRRGTTATRKRRAPKLTSNELSKIHATVMENTSARRERRPTARAAAATANAAIAKAKKATKKASTAAAAAASAARAINNTNAPAAAERAARNAAVAAEAATAAAAAATAAAEAANARSGWAASAVNRARNATRSARRASRNRRSTTPMILSKNEYNKRRSVGELPTYYRVEGHPGLTSIPESNNNNNN